MDEFASTMAAIAETARRSSWPELATLMAALTRPSIGLSVAPAAPAAGYYGGLPRLPEGVAWPAYADWPMVLLAQLDCAALAPMLGLEWTLPADGWLLFFHDDAFAAMPDRDGRGDDGCRVLHVPAGAPVRSAPPDALVVPPRPLSAELAPSGPGLQATVLDELFRSDPPRALDVLSEFKAELPPAPRHRLLGWSDDDFFNVPGFRPVLQLEAEAGTAWGECVNVSFWAPEEDLAAGRLDRMRRMLEVA